MVLFFMRTRCHRRRMTFFSLNTMSSSRGMMHRAIRVSRQSTTNMMTSRMTSVTHSMSTLTRPLVNRLFRALTSLMTRTSSLPAERVSKKEKDMCWMWENRSSRSCASACLPATSIQRMR